MAPELLRSVGGLLINNDGLRFCNELDYRHIITEAIVKNCKSNDFCKFIHSYIVLNDECIKEFGDTINFYISKGFIVK